MRKSNMQEENIVKYLECLKKLKIILNATNRISMLKFSEDNKISKNISTVLSNGKIIRCLKKGKHSEWEWIGIDPNRNMAIRLIEGLGRLNPPRKKIEKQVVKKRGGYRVGSGRKTKETESNRSETKIKKSFFWGLFNYEKTIKS